MASRQGHVFKVCVFRYIHDDNGQPLQELTPDVFAARLKQASTYYPFDYFAIMHDFPDYEGEKVHYHIVVEFERKKTISGVISAICSMFRICNENAVSVEFSENRAYDIRYLTHETEPEPGEKPKHIYERASVITSDRAGFMGAHEHRNGFKDAVSLAVQSRSVTEIIRRLGYRDYMKYRSVIQDIRRENHMKQAAKNG